MGQQQSVTLPWTQATVTSLANALAQGVLTVDYGTYRATFRSLEEMERLLHRMTRYVNNQGDGQPVPNFRGSVYIQR